MMEGELGAFLRARRESVRPSQVGLPESSRRRTPGLRRAELATLAGISVEYLTRIEQGRDTRPSPKVLAALAEALRLRDDDVEFLNRLAAVSGGAELPRPARATTHTVRPAVRAILEQLEPAPCFVANHLGDLLAWTETYDRLVRPLGVLDHDRPNVLWYTFTDERARAAYLDWDRVADEHVADLYELHWGDGAVDALAEGLARSAGAEFSDRWERRPLGGRRSGVRELLHPEAGRLKLSFEVLSLPDADQRLVILLPGDTATMAGLKRLGGHDADDLRVVSAG